MIIKKNVFLSKHTTFKIGGLAEYFCVANNKEDIIKAVKWAKERKLPFFVLGNGSNLLVSDKGYKGLVIKTGKPLFSYISKGLEWAVGIPGTIEGAVYGNAGVFEKSMKDVVESVKVLDAETEKIKVFKNRDCQFTYRDSIFKRNKNLIILSVRIKPCTIFQGDGLVKRTAQKMVQGKPKKSNPKKIKEYLNYKKETQPLNFPSAGSVFKNPPGFSAGELIEKCGLKGKKIGKVKISEKHANFIVNLGGAKAKDVLRLIEFTKRKVKNKFGINLQEEIQIISPR